LAPGSAREPLSLLFTSSGVGASDQEKIERGAETRNARQEKQLMSPPVGQAFGRNLEVNMQKLDVVYVYADDIVPLN